VGVGRGLVEPPDYNGSSFDTLNVAKGYSGSCPDGRINFDAQAPVEAWTSGSHPNHGIVVRAQSETANNGWKKFRSEDYGGASTDPYLAVSYNTYPKAVSSCTPSNDTISTDTTPTLSCLYNDDDSGDLGHVDYQICNDSTCSSIALVGEGTLGVNPAHASPWTLSGTSGGSGTEILTSGREYWWRARSDDGGATKGPWSSIWRYIPNQAPVTPTLESPGSGAAVPMITPVFMASDGDADPIRDADDNPLNYEFEIGEDSGFSSSRCTSGWLPTTNTWTADVETCALEDGETYYWRARTKDPFQTSAWTAGRAFEVSLPLVGASGLEPMWSHGSLSVNLVSGNLAFALPGPSYRTALGSLEASVAYNSLDDTDEGLGPGWALDVGGGPSRSPSRLVDHGLMDHEDGYDAVEVEFPDGDPQFFTHVGSSSTYLSEPGDGSQLTKNENGTWTLLAEDGFIFAFGEADPVLFAATLAGVEHVSAAPGGWATTYTFSVTDPTKLTSLEDASGRELVFHWHSLESEECDDAILCITGPDDVTWKYIGTDVAGTAGRLAGVDNGTRDLYALTYESGLVATLQNANDLDPTNASPGYDPDHTLEVNYDGSDRVEEISEGPVTGQSPSTSTWTFDYQPGAVTTPATDREAAGYSTITPPLQQGEVSPLAYESYYDDRGREIERVNLLGAATATEYNDADQVVWSEDEAGSRTDFVWDERHNALLSETGPDPDGAGGLGRPVTRYRYDETKIGTSGTAGPALQGLQASYFSNPSLAGRPAAQKNDTSVDFAIGGGWPNLGGQTTNFSVRWIGDLLVEDAGQYIFTTQATDGTRLTVDDVHAIEVADRVGAAAATSSEPVTLAAGPHTIVLEFLAQSTSSAQIELRWACTECEISEQIVPTSALRPVWMNQTSIISPSDNVSFSHFAQPASGQSDYQLDKLGGTDVISSYTYDGAGRPTQKVMPKGNTARTIDGSGNLTGSADTDYTITWEYYSPTETAEPPEPCEGDNVAQGGLLKSVTHAGMAPTTTVHDAASHAVAVVSASGVRCDVYDPEGRLVSSSAPIEYDGATYETLTYSYDPAGAQRSASDGTLATSLSYDESGRPRLEVDSFGAEIGYSYDAEGNLLARSTTPPSESTYVTEYEYDPERQLTQLTDPASREFTFTHTERGQLKTVQYPNGTFVWMTYDAAGHLSHLYNRHGTLSTPLPGGVPSDASPIADYSYEYDLEGRPIAETRAGDSLPTETTSYTEYDSLGRLAEVLLADGTCRQYLFDLDSNRAEVKEGATCGSTSTTETYDYSATVLDQLEAVTHTGQDPVEFTYETGGETATRGADALAWDGRGRLVGGIFDSASVSYGFDPDGFLRERVSASQTTHFLSGGLYETNTSGVITLSAMSGPAGDLAHYAGVPSMANTITYRYYDGRGNLIAEADSDGDRTAFYAYDAFGAITTGGAPANAMSERFTARWGKKFDGTSQLVGMGVRSYDPTLGRFLQVDPVVNGSANAYDYAFHNPTSNYDLSGMTCGEGVFEIIPDRIPGAFHFRASCRFHDRCYSLWGTWRILCDGRFHGMMRESCRDDFGWWSPRRYACYGFAAVYYNAVRRVGWPFFIDGQMSACPFASRKLCFARAVYRSH
jgi:RHS repeat-associated protein